jgi:hypothetical protein
VNTILGIIHTFIHPLYLCVSEYFPEMLPYTVEPEGKLLELLSIFLVCYGDPDLFLEAYPLHPITNFLLILVLLICLGFGTKIWLDSRISN